MVLDILSQVEDLFFNTPQRLKSLQNATGEYARIVSVVLAYSIHNAGIAISCKRQNGAQTADVNTQVNSTVLDNIGLSYGEAVRKELVEVKAESEEHGFKVKAWCSGPNYQGKKGTFLFFINSQSQFLSLTLYLVTHTCSSRSLRRLFASQTSTRRFLWDSPRQRYSPFRLPLALDLSEQDRRQRTSDQKGSRIRRSG